MQSEIISLKSDYDNISRAIDGVKNDQQIALADISQKLHQMELQLKELQVTLFILLDENRGHSTSVEKRLPSNISRSGPNLAAAPDLKQMPHLASLDRYFSLIRTELIETNI